MTANRWPQGYIDPAKIRSEGHTNALRVGAFVFFWTKETLYVVHATSLFFDRRVTRAPRTEPIAGFEIQLAPS